MQAPLRLQVFLSRAGVCSRRKAFELIKTGQVTVNGIKVYEPSTPVNFQGDQVALDGKIIAAGKYEYILLNKPAGVVTTKKDRFAKTTVLDILPENLRHLHPVGRLDKDTEGLLLLTNDGSVTHKMTHPRFEIDKTYFVEVKGRLQPADIQRLENGIILDNIKTTPARFEKVSVHKGVTEFMMTIHEGRKRQIRFMMDKVRHPVIRLKRIAQGPIKLGDLKSGEFRSLTGAEIEKVHNMITN